jgi:hypothetical protein
MTSLRERDAAAATEWNAKHPGEPIPWLPSDDYDQDEPQDEEGDD